MFEIVKNTKINFLGLRKISYVLSMFLVLMGIFGLFRIITGSANMGLDFTGGISVQLKFSKPMTSEKIREILEKVGYKVYLQKVGAEADNTFLIRTTLKDIKSATGSTEIINALKKETQDNDIVVLEENVIGPVVSAQLKQKALYAIFWAAIGILIYIWVRFQFKFAVSATLATMHDVLVVLGILVFLNKEIDILVITALLTIAGYSLTDTVVVFDRIRENMRNILKESFESIINRSLNEVLSRTLITSGTTLLVAISLYLFGGMILNNFAFTIVLGIVVGTYSSCFIASPVVFDWEMYEKKQKVTK